MSDEHEIERPVISDEIVCAVARHRRPRASRIPLRGRDNKWSEHGMIGQVDIELIAAQRLIDVIDPRIDGVVIFKRLHGAEERPKIQIDSYSGKVRALRSEEHTSELQSLRHLVCR